MADRHRLAQLLVQFSMMKGRGCLLGAGKKSREPRTVFYNYCLHRPCASWFVFWLAGVYGSILG